MAKNDYLPRLRRMIDDRIPSGGSDQDTQYTDEELLSYYEEYRRNLYRTAAEIWFEKASAVSSGSGISSYSVAGESYTFEGKGREHALSMYEEYMRRASQVTFVKIADTDETTSCRDDDLTRLMCDPHGWSS